jgi:Flp pilus assembly pilin Flp
MNLRRRFRRETGQTSTEYVVVLGLITTGIVLVFMALSTASQTAIQRVVDLIP